VVAVVVGSQDVGEPPTPLLQLTPDLGTIWRINAGGLTGTGIMDQDAVIVGPADELVKLELRHGASLNPAV
jgi:hypothetical protein